MAKIRTTDTRAQTGRGIPDHALDPERDAGLETELEREERRRRQERKDEEMFGEHPDGVGPTLGQDLGQPNPGRDLGPDVEGDED